MSQPRTVHPRRLKHRITSALGGSFCGTADGRPRDYGPKNQDPDQGQGLGRNRDPGQDCPQAGEEPDDSASRALHALSLLARQIVLPPARGIRYSRLYCKATARAGIPRTKHSRQPCSAAMHKEPKSNDSNVEHVTPGRPSAASSRIDAL
ncbi:hypothetical protein ACCO45_000874 [Purpureocillium lilacinum]|uniref:Uncharacterized protein n=1 Tax=Purpureocillium lilacinum TaxID=33203 RepID=A0ACC4E5E9_PURLI